MTTERGLASYANYAGLWSGVLAQRVGVLLFLNDLVSISFAVP